MNTDTANLWNGKDFNGSKGIARWTLDVEGTRTVIVLHGAAQLIGWKLEIMSDVPETVFTAAFAAACQEVK